MMARRSSEPSWIDAASTLLKPLTPQLEQLSRMETVRSHAAESLGKSRSTRARIAARATLQSVSLGKHHLR